MGESHEYDKSRQAKFIQCSKTSSQLKIKKGSLIRSYNSITQVVAKTRRVNEKLFKIVAKKKQDFRIKYLFSQLTID